MEDLTAAHLGGATERELAAFRTAALETALDLEAAELLDAELEPGER